MPIFWVSLHIIESILAMKKRDWVSWLCSLRVYQRLYPKILKIWTPKNFAVIILKFEQHGFNLKVSKHADRMANSVDPD